MGQDTSAQVAPQGPQRTPENPSAGDTDDRPYRPADDKEEIYFEGSPLLRGDLGHVVRYCLIGLAIIAIPILWELFATVGPDWIWWVVLIPLGILVMFVPSALLKTTRYRVSNYRIDFERGLFSKNIDTLELWHVDDIRFHQSLLGRMLGVGTIEIIADDATTPKLRLHGLPRPRPLFESLKQRIIAVKRQRGVIKMDMGA